jgi:hypothetical protein
MRVCAKQEVCAITHLVSCGRSRCSHVTGADHGTDNVPNLCLMHAHNMPAVDVYQASERE